MNPKDKSVIKFPMRKGLYVRDDDEEVEVFGLNSRLRYPDMAVSVQSAHIRVRVLFQKF